MEKYYKIAGLTVKMDCADRLERQAEPYRCAPVDKVDIVIEWPQEDPTGEKWGDLSREDIQYLEHGAEFYLKLLLFSGLMIHASAVVVDGKAYLFSATSGTGKSTHTQLWLQEFGDRAFILNDDKPALRLEDGVWYAYGTPFSGKHDMSANCRVPLGGIAILERGDKNEIQPFTGAGAIYGILGQTLKPKNPKGSVLVLELLDKLVSQAKIWKLKCNMEPEAAHVAFDAMSKE